MGKLLRFRRTYYLSLFIGCLVFCACCFMVGFFARGEDVQSVFTMLSIVSFFGYYYIFAFIIELGQFKLLCLFPINRKSMVRLDFLTMGVLYLLWFGVVGISLAFFSEISGGMLYTIGMSMVVSVFQKLYIYNKKNDGNMTTGTISAFFPLIIFFGSFIPVVFLFSFGGNLAVWIGAIFLGIGIVANVIGYFICQKLFNWRRG